MRFIFAAAVTLSFATAAVADPGSDFKRADQALNQTFKKIQNRLDDDPAGKARLVKAQRAWIAFRNAECTFQSSGDDGGSAAPMVVAECQAELTQDRTKHLKTYLNCQEGDLALPGTRAMIRSKTMPGFKMRYVLLMLVPLAFAGCVSVREDQRAMDQDKCTSFGYRPGTNRFADCMMKQSAQRDDDTQRSLTAWNGEIVIAGQARRNSDDDIDTRPSYDKDGNPNFDTQGNYQGCHGIGCEVDNPDTDDDNN